jgi:hypothetical protein
MNSETIPIRGRRLAQLGIEPLRLTIGVFGCYFYRDWYQDVVKIFTNDIERLHQYQHDRADQGELHQLLRAQIVEWYRFIPASAVDPFSGFIATMTLHLLTCTPTGLAVAFFSTKYDGDKISSRRLNHRDLRYMSKGFKSATPTGIFDRLALHYMAVFSHERSLDFAHVQEIWIFHSSVDSARQN